jgi:hypothetical protein
VFKLFKYEYPLIPYRIARQENKEKMCYEITKEMELEFTFLKCSDDMSHLIWRLELRMMIVLMSGCEVFGPVRDLEFYSTSPL